MGSSQLEPLFNPKSIAVFGARKAGASVGSRVYANLVASGFDGPVVPINPKYQEIDHKRCYSSIADVEEDIDLAILATPAAVTVDIFRECGMKGIRNAIILSAGFGETSDDSKALEAELLDVARQYGIRFLGPNCVGLVRPWLSMNATFLKSITPKGHLALVSQSGALCSAISDWAEPHHFGFSALVSVGNSTSIDFGDVLKFLSTDVKTNAILLYVEGVRDARSFISALRIAARLKPVIVLKAGRHNQSAQAAHTHTGALIGSDVVFDAALERAGAVRVETFGQLFAAAEILSANSRSKGKRLGIITNGGGAGVLAADSAEDLRLDLPPPSVSTKNALDEILPPFWSGSNPVDILGDAQPERFEAAVKICVKDPNFDGLLVMLTPQAMTDAEETARAIKKAIPEGSTKPVLACWMGESSVAKARKILAESGIPNFLTPERAVEAFSYLVRHERNGRLLLEMPGPLSDLETPDVEGARMIIQAVLSEDRTMLSTIESKAVLHAFRIPINTTLEANSPAKALIAAETVDFPIAMKINSPQITHKTDAGGVRRNIMGAADIAAVFHEITDNAKAAQPDAEILGVTVEAMANVEEARELVVGVSRDPVFGPVILFGAGGTMVEILSDSAVSLPPLNAVLADRLINRTRVSHLLDAFRDRPAVERTPVINVLLRISDLVCEIPEIEELDINPLFAGPDGVIAVDARIKVSRPSASVGRYDHMAISPYPRHLVQNEILADGTPLTIRPIRPEDAQSEQAFVRDLSFESKKFRFMHAMNELTPAALVRFTQIDYSHEMAFVAVAHEKDNDADKHVQLGVARYVINPDETSCEFAIVVSDNRQHEGIGTRLMKVLMDAARDHGLTMIEGSVLADNHNMLRLMDELGFTNKRSKEDRDLFLVNRRI
ncbi:MAG: bifunctional acetate--CoA ligase family protein/GNAT family N-acetyltransferase [bacterium]|nr:bifunctional acetate--CoA ligase family protein/GNAT family N-acetyltransferase [bacterium]